MSLIPKPDADPHHSGTSHSRLDAAKEALELGGLEIPGISPLLFLWRKLGIKGVALCMLFVGFPVGEYSALRYAVYSGLPRMIGGFGLDFEAKEWSLSPFSMRAVARDVVVKEPGGEQAVFTAAEVEFHGSAWTLLRGLPDMLTFHMFGGQQPFNDIIVKHGELHLERSLTGHLNWADFVEAVPEARLNDALDGIYRINSIRLEDFRVSYVENIPGGSGDGVIRTAQAQVKVDEVTGTITDIVPPAQFGDRPTRFKINGRSADGVFEFSGAAALFPPEGGTRSTAGEGIRRVSLGGDEASVSYPYEISVYLENVAAGAYGRMVPVTTIVPVNGIIAGTTKIVHTGVKPTCSGGFTMTNVRFAPNPLVLTNPDEVEVVRRGVSNLVYTGPFQLCDSGAVPAAAGRTQPPAAGMVARLAEQATVDASPGIKAIVARDSRSLRGEKVDAVDTLTSALAEEMGMRLANSIGGRTGVVARQAVESRSASGGGAVKGTGRALSSGAKSVGSGIKRLFGGGRKNDDKKND